MFTIFLNRRIYFNEIFKKKFTLIFAESDEIIKLLVEKGADINQIDNQEKTALQYACERGNLKNFE